MLKVFLVALLAVSGSGAVQHDHAAMLQTGAGATTSLTAEQIDQLLAGEGMGLARPAELNHYPGPKHLLELSRELGLSAEQMRQVEAIRASMLAAAKRLGAQIVEAERALDAAFASARINETQLTQLTATIGRLQGELRAAHLQAHLASRRLLRPEQIVRYDELRGHPR